MAENFETGMSESERANLTEASIKAMIKAGREAQKLLELGEIMPIETAEEHAGFVRKFLEELAL